MSLGERIIIIGPSCAGKSTLADILAERLALSAYHLDALRAGKNGRENFDRMVSLLLAGDRWILEGCYVSVLPPMLARASSVVYLDFSRWTCLRELLRRPAIRPDWPLLKWILWDYPERTKPRIDAWLGNQQRVPVYRLQRAAQVQHLLRSVPL